MSNYNVSYAQYQNAITNNPQGGGVPMPLLARVTHVVQGPYLIGTDIPDTYYTDPTSLGVITFQFINGMQDRTLDSSGNTPAKPFSSVLKQLPLEGELVEIVQGPSVDMNTSRGARDYYYTMPFNVWNASHHNAFPDMGDYGAYVGTIQRSYAETSDTKQSTNASATGSLIMPLGPNFPEKADIKSLRQFTGDVTIEGRWGNSIRFGSTAAVTTNQNYWSATGSAGAPITIIRNGQGRQVDNLGWFPTVENINTDPSSIYLTAGQLLKIDDLSNFSLASLEVDVQNVRTTSIPIQQQLTSTDNISPTAQDLRISNNDSNTANFTSTESSQPTTGSSQPITENIIPKQKINVVGDVGDLQAIDGTYVVSLRAVNSAGEIISSVSEIASTLQVAYSLAVEAIKKKNIDVELVLPSLRSLIN